VDLPTFGLPTITTAGISDMKWYPLDVGRTIVFCRLPLRVGQSTQNDGLPHGAHLNDIFRHVLNW